MRKTVQYGLFAAGLIGLVLAVIFYLDAAFNFRWPIVRDFWPWVGSYARLTPLSLFFISSIFAAFAASLIWVGWTGEIRAIEGGALDVTIISGGSLIFVLQSYFADGGNNPRLMVAAVLCALVCITSAALFFWIQRVPFQSPPQSAPGFVKLSFGIFCILLLIFGTLLVLKSPNVFPWPLRPEVSVIYGWVFLGTLAYYLHGFVRPSWQNACGQLLGFLGYDLVLIFPFIAHFAVVHPEHRLSLIIYTGVLIFSGSVAVYYCFIHPSTRLWRPAPTPATQLQDA